jgi:hypothetical protein
MLAKAQRLILIGGVFAVCGTAGLWYSAPALCRAFEVLTEQPPDIEQTIRPLTLAALALGIGILSVLLGLRSLGAGHALSVLGRAAVLASGCATMAGGAGLLWGLSRVNAAFRVIASSEVAPTPADVAGLVAAGSAPIYFAFGLALLGQWPLLFALLRGFWQAAAPHRLPPGARIGLPLVAMAAVVGLVISLVLAYLSASHALLMAADGLAKPADLADALSGGLRYGMIGGICLVVSGATVALAALAQPWPRPPVDASSTV